MKTLVAYYSRKGSNSFLAEKIADRLECDIESIKPRINLFLFFLMGINWGIRRMKSPVKEYDRVIMVGPVFIGRFIPPLEAFVKRYDTVINKLIFATCCGSTYKSKDEKFGHGLVFKKVEDIMGDKLVGCQAFPIELLLPESQKGDSDAYMKTHLNADNFKGEILQIFNEFIKKLT